MSRGNERPEEAMPELGWRVRAYLRLSRLLPPRSYLGKVLLVNAVGVYIPLAILVVSLQRVARSEMTDLQTWPLIALVLVLVGSVLALTALWILLAPVALASQSLRRARNRDQRSTLPIELDDEGGRLLADTQRTLDYFETIVERLEQEAATDALTGVLNRRAAERRLREDLATLPQMTGRLAVALFDIDGLKAVNDRWGHPAGDAALAYVASTLVQHVHGRGWTARWGGDEFLVVLTEHDGGESAEAILASVASNLATAPVPDVDAGEARLGVSWGFAWAMPGDSVANAVRRADTEYYRAKQPSPGPGLA